MMMHYVQQGLQQGEFEAKKATAKKLIARGMPAEEIAEITGLSIEIINEP